MFLVAEGFYFFKGWEDFSFHFIKQGGAESDAQVGVVKVAGIAPETVITITAFRNEAMDMGFHFKSLLKVWSTIRKPGVKFMDLFCLKNIWETTLLTE